MLKLNSQDPTEWLTEWAAEPRDIYYDNLALPYVDLKIRRIIGTVAYFFFTFFFMIPITFVQSLANIEGIKKFGKKKKNIEGIEKALGFSFLEAPYRSVCFFF